MPFKFNPFSGNFDQTGSGGGGGGASYIDGEVQNFSALPETVGSPAVDSAYLVREAEGTWLINRKPAGIYIRTANTGSRAADWTHAGAFPDVFNDANFLLYDNADSTKNLAFQLSGITTGTTRTLTVPNASGTLALVGDAPASHTHGNITNGGLVGTTANLPLKTGTGGIVEAGAFGTSAGQFSEGNHTHELDALAATGITAGKILTADGDNTASWQDAPAGGDTVSINASAADVLSVTSGEISADDAGADRIVFWDDSASALKYLEAGSGLSLSGTTLTATATGTIGGGTGSTDNSIVRADGAGGSTVQDSALVIDDATTSTQANVAIINAHSETNSALVLTPKGTGAFIVGPKPDGTASVGGNARGTNAVDLQLARTAATQVASGANSFCVGDRNTASQTWSSAVGGALNTASGSLSFVAGGQGNSASQNHAFCGAGNGNTASFFQAATVGGDNNTASNTGAATLGGQRAVADRYAIHAHAGGRFAANGDAQRIRAVLRNKTTTNSAVELFLDGSSARLTVPSGKVMAMLINITGTKSDGSAVAHYVRQYCIKNVGGTTSEVYAAVTIGTDNAASTSITLSANDTNDAVKIEATGIASETWRWVASVDAVEVAYGN